MINLIKRVFKIFFETIFKDNFEIYFLKIKNLNI